MPPFTGCRRSGSFSLALSPCTELARGSYTRGLSAGQNRAELPHRAAFGGAAGSPRNRPARNDRSRNTTLGPGGIAMPFYQKGDVRIRYEETGSGFPLLVTPGGGLNSRVSNWPTAVFNAMEAFKNDFRCITMDQRNANGGESTGPVPVDNPWDAFADDQLGADGPPRHPRILLHGLLHRRLLCRKANASERPTASSPRSSAR